MVKNLKKQAGGIHPLLSRKDKLFRPPKVAGKRILVTGSSGSIGSKVCDLLKSQGANVQGFDVDEGLDVTDLSTCMDLIHEFKPYGVIHLAAHKYATSAEGEPYRVANLNVHGTHYLCHTAKKFGVRKLIVASTCKSIQPETVYGASKLIAERIALNYGYTVGRFFNVIESAGNVFEIWREHMKSGGPLKVTPCKRYFISANEAVSFISHLLDRRPARYALSPGDSIAIEDMAQRFAPGHPLEYIPPRRGDRLVEPLIGDHETYRLIDGELMVIKNPHDLQEKEPSIPERGGAYWSSP